MGQQVSTETANNGGTLGPSTKVHASSSTAEKPLMRKKEAALPRILACTRVHNNNGAGKHPPLEKVVHDERCLPFLDPNICVNKITLRAIWACVFSQGTKSSQKTCLSNHW